MKPAGFLCNIDNLGRILIPAPIRKTFEINGGDTFEVFTDEDGIMLKNTVLFVYSAAVLIILRALRGRWSAKSVSKAISPG